MTDIEIKKAWENRREARGCNCTDINPCVCEFSEFEDCECDCHDFENCQHE